MTEKEISAMTDEEIQKQIESLVTRDAPVEEIEGLPQTEPDDKDTDEELDK